MHSASSHNQPTYRHLWPGAQGEPEIHIMWMSKFRPAVRAMGLRGCKDFHLKGKVVLCDPALAGSTQAFQSRHGHLGHPRCAEVCSAFRHPRLTLGSQHPTLRPLDPMLHSPSPARLCTSILSRAQSRASEVVKRLCLKIAEADKRRTLHVSIVCSWKCSRHRSGGGGSWCRCMAIHAVGVVMCKQSRSLGEVLRGVEVQAL
jgi:hypothetical protein